MSEIASRIAPREICKQIFAEALKHLVETTQLKCKTAIDIYQETAQACFRLS